MSDLRSEIVSKVLNSWEPTPVQVEEQSITRKIFAFVKDNPSCTINDVVAGTSVELGRASATTLALYQRGKLDRKLYPNPDPNGKRANVYVYWTTVDKFTDATFSRNMKKAKKLKQVKTTQAERITNDILEPIFKQPRMKQFADGFSPKESFDPEQFVKGLSLTEVKQLHKFLESYFE